MTSLKKYLCLAWGALFLASCTQVTTLPPETTRYITNEEFDQTFRDRIPEVLSFNISISKALELLKRNASRLSKDRQVEIEFLRLIQTAEKEKEISGLLKFRWKEESEKKKSILNNFIRNYQEYTNQDLVKNPAYRDALYLLSYLADDAVVDKRAIAKKIQELTAKEKIDRALKGYALQVYLYRRFKEGKWEDLDAWLDHLNSLTSDQVFVENLKHIQELAETGGEKEKVTYRLCFYYQNDLRKEFEKFPQLTNLCLPEPLNLKVEYDTGANGLPIIEDPYGYATKAGMEIAGRIMAGLKETLPAQLKEIVNANAQKGPVPQNNFTLKIKAVALEPSYENVAVNLRIQLVGFYLDQRPLKKTQLVQLASTINESLNARSFNMISSAQTNRFVESYLEPFFKNIQEFEKRTAFFAGDGARKNR